MAKKIILKTRQTSISVTQYLNNMEPENRRKEAKILARLFKQTTGAKPKMWGPSIVGYGKYTYYRSNGDIGEYLACGFSIRKSGPTLYIMPGYTDYSDLLNQVGPHKTGKSCVYLKSLDGINLEALATLIKRGLKDLSQSHKVDI